MGVRVFWIACIIFNNPRPAGGEKGAGEGGKKKVIGSRRKDLILQFLLESFVLTFISFLLSLLLVQLTLPAFNLLTGNKLHIPIEYNTFWSLMVGYVLITALMAVYRHAFYVFAFNPIM